MAGSWFVVCSGAGTNAGVIGREGNRAARAAKMFPSGQEEGRAGGAGTRKARCRERSLPVRSERSESPAALRAAPARLNKPGYAADPATGDIRSQQGPTWPPDRQVPPKPVQPGPGNPRGTRCSPAPAAHAWRLR